MLHNIMYFTLKHIIPKVNNLIISVFVSGFCIGCFPNKLCVNFNDKRYNSVPIPLISGIMG